MSIEQYKIQADVFDRRKASSKEEAIRHLFEIGVMNLDGTLTEEYQFLEQYRIAR